MVTSTRTHSVRAEERATWLNLTAVDLVLALGFTFVADIIVNHVAFRLRIRDTKW